MTDFGARIDRILRTRRLTQTELAREAGIDQSSVSRMMRAPRVRLGPAYLKLVRVMQQYESHAAPPRALKALQDAWDRSDEHDSALEHLIVASKAFRPKMEE